MSRFLKHYPVMYQSVLKRLQHHKQLKKFVIADCNFGLGGHSHQILKNFSNAYIQAYELDSQVLQFYNHNIAKQLPEQTRERLIINNCNFVQIGSKQYKQYDAVIADLGYNSLQLQDMPGFSWKVESQLDMRYDKNEKVRKCSDIVNTASQLQLTQIFQKFGQLRQANRIAKRIVEKRPIKTTIELRDSVVGTITGAKPQKLARVFQSLRIITNDELGDLQRLIAKIGSVLVKNGIAMIITFHSLQRKVLMNYIKDHKGIFHKQIIHQKPEEKQLLQNSKSSSAQMIILKKI